ncbi:hypothetical protein N7G274_008438 [Stereocaulon virgatum]|uniref:Uncharacterized protein n=1 Tax=Stereocaulon virgatum TaxID=373712 RepID=A0ABR3ZZP0_9LECA
MSSNIMAILLAMIIGVPSLGNAQISLVSTPQPIPTALLSHKFPPLSTDWGARTNETIGELVDVLEVDSTSDSIPDNSTITQSYNNSTAVALNTNYLSARGDTSGLTHKYSNARIISAVYNSTDNGYYNISIPGCIAADDIIGDIEAPNGTQITNASYGTLVTTLNLPGKTLYNYTLTMMEKQLTELNATLDKIVCDGPQGPARTLLWPPALRPNWRNPDTSDGYISTFLIGGGGVVSIAWGGTRLAIAKAWPTENITMDTEVGLLAATSLVQYLFITALFRLQSSDRRWIGRAEAAVLNGLIWVGAQVIKFLDFISGSTCIQTDTARAGVTSMMNALGRQAFVVGSNAARGATMATSWSVTSLTNLISVGQATSSVENIPDLEAGVVDAGHVGQPPLNIVGVGMPELTEVVVTQIEHQLSGSTQPGEVCQ